jgi:hypothetical protein
VSGPPTVTKSQTSLKIPFRPITDGSVPVDPTNVPQSFVSQFQNQLQLDSNTQTNATTNSNNTINKNDGKIFFQDRTLIHASFKIVLIQYKWLITLFFLIEGPQPTNQQFSSSSKSYDSEDSDADVPMYINIFQFDL